MEDCKTLEFFIEEKKIYAENYKDLEIRPNVENLLKTSRKSSSAISSDITLALQNAETPQSCGSICVFNRHQEFVFNCGFCELKFGDLDNFGRHLHESHNLILQNEENAGNFRKSSRISNAMKKKLLGSAISLPLLHFTEPLVYCGNVFVLKERKFLMACGYCHSRKYDSLEMFEKHISQQHNILVGAYNELNVVPKVETKEEGFIIIETDQAEIKVEMDEEAAINRVEMKDEQNYDERSEEFQDTESCEEVDEDIDKESELDDGDEEYTISVAAKRKCTSTALKKGTTWKKKQTNELLSSTEENPYACEFCEKKFKHNYLLKSHTTSHTGDKPYECDICNKRFRLSNVLGEHMKRIHKAKTGKPQIGEKPFKCDKCNRRYRNRLSLYDHKKMAHLDVQIKSVKCEVCQKLFKRNSERLEHMRSVHRENAGENQYKCDLCQRCYSTVSILRKHVKFTHGGI